MGWDGTGCGALQLQLPKVEVSVAIKAVNGA
jgi:hypothetical protein